MEQAGMKQGKQSADADVMDAMRALFDTIDDGACIVRRVAESTGGARDYHCLAMNAAMQAMFGVEDLTGQAMLAHFPGEHEGEAWLADCDRVLATGRAMRVERDMPSTGMLLSFSISPLRGGNGEILPDRLLMVMRDVTQRQRAEEALARSEQQMHALLRASSDIIFRMNADWSEMRQLHGRAMLADTAATSIRWLDDYIFPEDQPVMRAAIEDALLRGGTFELEHRVRRADGAEGWVASRAVPQFDRDGAIVEWFGMASDVTGRVQARHEAEAASARLARREALLSNILAASSDCIKLIGLDGCLTFINEGGMRTAEIADMEQVKGSYWPDTMITPESRGLARAAIAAAAAGKTSQFEGEGRTWLGKTKWWNVTVSPLYDGNGAVHRILAISRDHTAIREVQEHQRLLNGELRHRLKNLLSLVQSIVSQTLRNADNVDDASVKVASRMLALAQATDGLTGAAWKEGALCDIIRAGLSCVFAYGERIALSGPELRIAAPVAMAMTLTVHELATNATKYGALSNDSGMISLRWSVVERGGLQHFLFDWQENGGPPVYPPRRRGFGSRMIERVLLAHVTGRMQVDYAHHGLHVSIDTPLSDLVEGLVPPEGRA